MNKRSEAENIAEQYYDSSDADTFYERVWGGEDIHIGLYESGLDIYEASRRTVVKMAQNLADLNEQCRVLDLGAGYGGAARYLAKTFGCKVTCLNLSETQNARNRELCQQQNLQDNVSVVHGSFENIPEEHNSFDVVWSQDAFLHSGKRHVVLQEVARVLQPGGELIFTDPMQADDCPQDVLKPVYDRLHLDSLASVAFYRKTLAALGFMEILYEPLTHQLRQHYFQVGESLRSDYKTLSGDVSHQYLDRMITGLDNWVKAADDNYLAWGILYFQKNV